MKFKKHESPVTVITGAGSGIGLALARRLARRGHRLALAGRRPEVLDVAANNCRALGADAIDIQCDVSIEADCDRLIQATLRRYGRLDILVNNAGVSMYAPFADHADAEIFRRLINTNYMGVVHCCLAALEHLRWSRGLIVGISSLQGKTGFPGSTGYSASKFAVQGFLDSLRIELEDDLVGVLVVSPGPIDTEIHTNRFSVTGTRNVRNPARAMSVEKCAERIERAIERRDRELIVPRAGKLIPWLRLIAPALVDRIIRRKVEDFYDGARRA